MTELGYVKSHCEREPSMLSWGFPSTTLVFRPVTAQTKMMHQYDVNHHTWQEWVCYDGRVTDSYLTAIMQILLSTLSISNTRQMQEQASKQASKQSSSVPQAVVKKRWVVSQEWRATLKIRSIKSLVISQQCPELSETEPGFYSSSPTNHYYLQQLLFQEGGNKITL